MCKSDHKRLFKVLLQGCEGLMEPEFSNYRGVYRLGPPHLDYVGEDHPANIDFFWYCNEEEEHGGSHDLSRLRRLVQRYSEIAPSMKLEIIEVDTTGFVSVSNGLYLGTDIANRFGMSLLANGMLNPAYDVVIQGHDSTVTPQESLLQIVRCYMRERLNAYGLVAEFGAAALATAALDFVELPEEVSECRPLSIYLINST